MAQKEIPRPSSLLLDFLLLVALGTCIFLNPVIATADNSEIEALYALRDFFGYPWTNVSIETVCQGLPSFSGIDLVCSGDHITSMYVSYDLNPQDALITGQDSEFVSPFALRTSSFEQPHPPLILVLIANIYAG
jgi:hypothetical protein